MTGAFRGLAALVLVLLPGARPAPLAAQTSLTALTTEELYAEARTRAAKVSDRCSMTRKSDYLEALTYLFAYYQVASRDGSLQSAPEFDRTIKNRFVTVLRTARKCLDLPEENSSAGMRDNSTGARVAAPPPVERVDLPAPPPPGAGGMVAVPASFSVTPKGAWLESGATQHFDVTYNPGLPPVSWVASGGTITASGQFTAGSAGGLYRLIAVRGNLADTAFIAVPGGEARTDAQGRTIPQLLEEIARLQQQREVFAAEVTRLRNLQAAGPPQPPPPPPPAPPGRTNMNGEYQIMVKANGLLWHEDGNGDRKISTRYQPNDDFTRFILEQQPDGSYRIRVKATNRYLHAPGHEDWILSTLAQVDDDYTHFYIVPDADQFWFRLRQKATGRYLGQGRDGVLTNNYPADDGFTRFSLRQ